MPRIDVVTSTEAEQAVGRPATDVPRYSDRTPNKSFVANERAQSPGGSLGGVRMSGMGDECLLGLAEEFAAAKMKLLITLYKSIDPDGDGGVTLDELHHALVKRPAMTQLLLEGGSLHARSTVADLHEALDGDGDGYATFEEMKNLFGLSGVHVSEGNG